ncbi:hypothetical protein MTR67_008912 [Solanum verrucosum]|uniref:FAD-binding PCMH-type domain-containing protein n=1 Tax=Solanum verrucosum TaxID=315347 RepID=A0AAF0Q373_SOLVR|nr:hypothetical protein MTR67_008912 [Solanum verrucosum]
MAKIVNKVPAQLPLTIIPDAHPSNVEEYHNDPVLEDPTLDLPTQMHTPAITEEPVMSSTIGRRHSNRNLRSISIDTEKRTAWIQAGATLGEVYYRIAQKRKNLAFIVGVCPSVGVGGHLSGGGYSMMSRKFGTAADNIIDAKLIDASGQIQDRESMGEDHFWAIRGGGGTSFGLVISWKVKLLDIPEKDLLVEY